MKAIAVNIGRTAVVAIAIMGVATPILAGISIAKHAFAQGEAPAGAVRILGPLFPAYTTTDNPLVDITRPGVINLPDWIINNPMRGDTTVSHKIPAGAVDLSGLPSGGGQGGLAAVASDNTLSGDGTASDPLQVTRPFTNADETKLDAIEENATRDQTPAELVSDLVSLTGSNRLPATAIRDLPVPDNVMTSVVHDGTLTGTGLSASPLGVAVAITQAQKNELADFATFATTASNYGKYIGINSSGALVARDGTTSAGTTIASHGTRTELIASRPATGTIAVVYGDAVANDGVYFKTGGNTAPDFGWLRIADLLPGTIPVGNLPYASGSQAGIIRPDEYAKIASAIDQTHLHDTPHISNAALAEDDAFLIDDASISGGASELREISVSELDKRWKQTTGNEGPVALTRLPSNTQIVSRAVQAGGNRPWPDSNIQFCGPIRSTPYQASEIDSATFRNNCSDRAVRTDGVRINPAYFVIRFSTTTYPNQPSLTDVPTLRAGVTDPEPEFPPVVPNDLTALGEANGHWYFASGIADLPAGQDGVVAEKAEPTTLDLDLAPGTVVPEDLKFGVGDLLAGRAVTIQSNGEFGSQAITDSRTLQNGPLTGLSVTANARSALATNNLTNSLNTHSEPHGIVSGTWTLTLAQRSNSNTTFHNGETTITVPFTTTIDAIARAPVFNNASNLGYILATTDVLTGSSQIGDIVLRAPQAADGTGRVSVSQRYEPQTGTSSSETFNVAATLDMFVIGTGTPRGTTGGQWFAYAALPNPNDFADGDLVLVYGQTKKGAWRKTSTETLRTADTGLAGKTLNPRFDLIARRVGNRDKIYYAPAGLGTGYPASNQWGTAPSQLASVQLTYDHTDNTNGTLLFTYTGNRSYTGAIVVRVGIYALHVDRVNATTWRLDGLTAGEVSTMQTTDWTFAEPDATGYNLVHSFDRVLGGDGPEYILDFTAGTHVGLTANQFVALNTSSWTRPLEAADDHRNLCVQVVLSNQSNIVANVKKSWSSPMCVNAKDWRTATATANMAAMAPNGVYAIGTTINADTTTGTLAPLTIAVTKGAGDKLAVRPATGATLLTRARAWLD